jgi:hypothetical protein
MAERFTSLNVQSAMGLKEKATDLTRRTMPRIGQPI